MGTQIEKTQLEFEFVADTSKVKKAIKTEEKSSKESTKRINEDRVKQRRKQLAEGIRQVRANARVEQQQIQKQFRLRLVGEKKLAQQIAAIQKKSRKEIQKIQGIGGKGGGGLLGGGLAGGIGKAGAIAGIAFATKQIIQFGSSALKTAARLELFDRRAKIVFTDSLPKITAAAEESAAAIGLTRSEFTAAASAAGDLLKPIGFTASQAADSSIKFLNLAGALKEFNADSRSVSEISRIVTKSLLGERDALTSFGIKISEAEIQTKLLEKGQKKLTGQALLLAKATVTQALLFEKSKDALISFNEEGFKPLSRTLNSIDAGFKTAGETLSEFIGRGLKPLAEALSSGLESFNILLGSLGGLRDVTATIVTLTSAVVALGIAFSVLGFGPLGLLVAAIAFGFGALAVAIDLVIDKNLTFGEQLKEERKELTKLIKTVSDLQKAKNKTAEQTRQLTIAESQLRAEADKLNISLFNQKGELVDVAKAQQLIIDGQKKLIQGRIATARAKLTPLELQRGVISPTGEKVKSFEKGLQTQIRNFETAIANALKAGNIRAARSLQITFESTAAGRISRQRAILAQLEKDLAALSAPAPKAPTGFGKATATATKAKAQQERFETIATFKFRQEQIESNLQKELDAIEEKSQADLKAEKEKFKLGKITRAEFAKFEQRLNKKTIAKKLEADLKATRAQRSSIEGAIKQFTTTQGLADLGGTALSKITGNKFLGGLAASIPAIGGAISGISDFFSGILDKTEELAEQEAKRQEQIENTTRLIKQEVDFQIKLIQLQRQRDALISKEAQTQIKLNAILIEDPKLRAAADLQVFKKQEALSRKAFGFEDISTQEVGDIINEAERTKVGNANVIAIAQRATESILIGANLSAGLPPDQVRSFQSQLQDAIGLGVSPAVSSFGNKFIDDLGSLGDIFNQEIVERNRRREFKASEQRDAARNALIGQAIDQRSILNRQISQAGVGIESQTRDLSNALQLLDIIGTVTEAERAISAGAGGFELTKAREQSFVNVGRGGVREAFGIFTAPVVQPQALDLPSGAASVALATKAAKSFSERQSDSLDEIAGILSDSLLALVSIEENTRNALGGTTAETIDQEIVIAEIFDRIAERNIA